MRVVVALLIALCVGQTAKASEFNFKVLSYNVQGLIWPIKKHKGELPRIGEILGEMRARGEHPDVVFLQEGFRDDKIKELIKNAGYPYYYKGPKNNLHPSDGGIYILSDYKILRSAKVAFGKACTGYDCLSNKGVMIAELEVPGFPEPIIVANTHMNSGKASGSPEAKYIKARKDQIAKIGWLLKQFGTEGRTVFFGGDFNTAPRKAPWDVLRSTLNMKNAQEDCMQNAGSCVRLSDDSDDDILIGAPDHVFYQAGKGVNLSPVSIEKTFKIKHGDRWISDHWGLEVVFKVETE